MNNLTPEQYLYIGLGCILLDILMAWGYWIYYQASHRRERMQRLHSRREQDMNQKDLMR
jgi:hypothetical protein